MAGSIMAQGFRENNAAVRASRELYLVYYAKTGSVVVGDQMAGRLGRIQGQLGVAAMACPVLSQLQQSCANALALKARIDTQLADTGYPSIAITSALRGSVRRIERYGSHDLLPDNGDKTVAARNPLASYLRGLIHGGTGNSHFPEARKGAVQHVGELAHAVARVQSSQSYRSRFACTARAG